MSDKVLAQGSLLSCPNIVRKVGFLKIYVDRDLPPLEL